jgi:uncharacterized protein YecT (DUF1311 family)
MRYPSILAGALLLLLGSPRSQAAEKIQDQAAAAKICAPFSTYKPGPAARPTDADRKRFGKESEDCLAYLYGLERPCDVDKGRRCCLVRGWCNGELAMIFANGWGVRRDYDAATYFLCRAKGERKLQEYWGMLGHLREMRTAKTPRDLDYCDLTISSQSIAWCQQLKSALLAPRRERLIAELGRGLNAAARQALTQLRRSANALTDADASVVADEWRGGTGAGAATLSAVASGQEAFVSTLETFGRKRAPETRPEELQEADRKLNEIYRAQQAGAQPCDPCVPSREILRDAQRAWLRYRDAWTAFYRLRWQGAAPPEVLDREIRAALTRQRSGYLTRER